MRSELVNREGFADDIHVAKLLEQATQPSGIDSIDFDVPVFRLLSHQFIPHTTAHQERAPRLFANRFCEIQNLLRDVHADSIKAGVSLSHWIRHSDARQVCDLPGAGPSLFNGSSTRNGQKPLD